MPTRSPMPSPGSAVRSALAPSGLLLDPGEQDLWNAAARYAGTAIPDDVDGREEFSRRAWELCADFGLTGLPIAKAYGGGGAGLTATCAAFDAFGYACRDNGLLFSVAAHLWAGAMTIERFGDQRQRERYLPGLSRGELIAAHAMTEPATGSDAFALTTTAEPVADGWVLNGHKRYITNAPVADVFVVFARIPGRPGPFGLVCLLVDAGLPGLAVGPARRKAGLRTSPTGEVAFEGCVVDGDGLLGAVGMGMAVFNHAIHLERACIMAAALGTMQRQTESAARALRPARRAGARSGTEMAADLVGGMSHRLHSSRLLLYSTVRRMEAGRVPPADTALVKTAVSEASLAGALDARRVARLLGVGLGPHHEREIQDALGGRLYSGTSEILRDLIGRGLGL